MARRERRACKGLAACRHGGPHGAALVRRDANPSGHPRHRHAMAGGRGRCAARVPAWTVHDAPCLRGRRGTGVDQWRSGGRRRSPTHHPRRRLGLPRAGHRRVRCPPGGARPVRRRVGGRYRPRPRRGDRRRRHRAGAAAPGGARDLCRPSRLRRDHPAVRRANTGRAAVHRRAVPLGGRARRRRARHRGPGRRVVARDRSGW